MSELRQPGCPTGCLFHCLSGFKNLIKRVASKAANQQGYCSNYLFYRLSLYFDF